MRQQSSLWRLALASVGLLVFGLAVSAQTATVLLGDGSPLSNLTPSIKGKLPVLFVHGHGDPANYQNNWQLPLVSRNLPSFKDALDANSGLGVEPYYISFANNDTRSITEDAIEIGDAVERILRRHDPDHAVEDTPVKVVIIAYSKGTISTRQYLKSLQTQVDDMPSPRPTFRPVSEFIAIAPPNHGLATRLFATTSSLSVKELYNGQRPRTVLNNQCGAAFSPAAGTDYVEILNKVAPTDTHVIEDTQDLSAGQIHPGEAPGSRSVNDPHSAGTLYVTLFDAADRDLVGGDIASSDCVGRAVASNLAPNAVNVPATGISEDGWETVLDNNPDEFDIGNIASALFTEAEKKSASVHQNTVHTFEVMCQALYAAVHHTSPAGVTCSPVNVTVPGLTGQVPVPVIVPPPRAAVMLTLDFSGSMSISTGPGANRASDLREAVRLFVELWGVVGVPSDRIGVNYFSTNVEPFPPSSNPVQQLATNGPAIINALPSHSPGGMTAMGNGLQQAIESLTSSATDATLRRIILFTDGLQNVNPKARIMNDRLKFVNESGPNSIVSPTAPAELDPLLGIAVDTIAVGDANLFVGDLEAIAATTNGQSRTTLNMSLLRQFFIETLINALKGFSPQLVAYRRGTVAGKGSTEAFAIEDGVHKLVLKASWKRGESLDFSVTKDGVDVTSAGRFITSDFYKIFVIDLPAKGPITARGNWQVQIRGNAGAAYEAAVIVDGSPIKYDSNFNLKQPRAGEPLDLVVRLTAGGQPINGTNVFVTLTSPTMTAGDIIAEKPLKDPPAFEPGMSIGERQLLALTTDPKRLALLNKKTRKLVLEPNGKGEFRARLDTSVPGLYTAFVTIEGNDPKFGQFTRTMTATTTVRFANADRKATEIFVSECDAGGRRYVRVLLSPRDANRHFMGPGSAADISLELSDGRMVGSPRDLGDGSYALLLEVQPGNDPMVTLKVAGAALFTGRLSQLLRKFRQ